MNFDTYFKTDQAILSLRTILAAGLFCPSFYAVPHLLR